MIEPKVMVWYCHLVESNAFGVLKEAVWPPDFVQPFDVQDAVFFAHVLRQSESVIAPALRQEDVRHVGLKSGSLRQN